jgi:hypothetical protein
MKSGGAADLTADQRCIQPVESGSKNQRFCWSMVIWWAWEDLNLRPHPYQQSRAHRYATRHFCRSFATVEGEVMRSNNLLDPEQARCRGALGNVAVPADLVEPLIPPWFDREIHGGHAKASGLWKGTSK